MWVKRSVFFIDLYCQNLHAVSSKSMPCFSKFTFCFKQDLHALLQQIYIPVSSRIMSYSRPIYNIDVPWEEMLHVTIKKRYNQKVA